MASVTDNLLKLQELTQTNLNILQALNNALYTKQNNITVNTNDRTYVIPSFVTLENKINSLQENFENLVNSPKTGEAYFNFDGDSKTIEVRGYTHTPNSLKLNYINTFNSEDNNIFKDFLTPNPYINIGLDSLPNDITSVNVKKIVPIHEELISYFKSLLIDEHDNEKHSVQYMYKDLYKILVSYKKGIDYIEYDSVMNLPIRKNIGNGLYVIQDIVSDIIDDNLDEYITVKLRKDINDENYSNKLSYKLFDETIEKPLKVGDCLVTYDDSSKLEIVEVKMTTNELVLKVLHGDYLNLYPSSTNIVSDIHNMSKLKFYSPVDFDNDKYIKVSLEEDQYIFIAVAALNNRLNIQSPWGTGLVINAFNLLKEDDGITSFKTFYDKNVNNIGDILYEVTSIMTNTITKYSEDQFNRFTKIRPVINTKNLLVTQINNHLNDSENIKNIRASYSQKKDLENQLNELNSQIATISQKLSEISFDDTSNIRSVYVDQLNLLNENKNKISSSILKIVNDIAQSVNSSEVPIENAKYRIRGFFNCNEFLDESGIRDLLENHITGIRVQYRYKNINREQGNALSINENFVFSDWVDMKSQDLHKIPYYEDGYKYKLQQDNSTVNEPSYNQIDIPISQGENVDIRLKVVYDFGYPFVFTSSDWSDIVNIEFPTEFSKNVQILDIISENNNDIETNRFNNIIKDSGIYDHINKSIMDQDIIYFHKPEDIASGFYTNERRIIPLKDKLQSMHNTLTELWDDVYGTHNNQVSVSIINGDQINDLVPNIINNINVASYDQFDKVTEDTMVSNGNYVYSDGVVSTILNIKITNNSNHTLKLYSVFPGSRETNIYDLVHVKHGIYKDEFTSNGGGVFCIMEKTENNKISQEAFPQTANQYITFRIKDVNNGQEYYKEGNQVETNYISLNKEYSTYKFANDKGGLKSVNKFAFIYPLLINPYYLHLESDNIGSYITIQQGNSITIPVAFEYGFKERLEEDFISKTMAFDLKTSLYSDPISYVFKVTAKYSNTMQDKIVSANNSLLSKYNSIYK